MKKSIFVILFSAGAYFSADEQKFYTKNGSISFFSKTNMENISAVNNQVMSVLVPQTGTFEFSLLVKGFHFEKALMEEHFNENYLESSTFPNAQFKGQISNLSEINFSQDGKYNAKASGKLTIHGVERDVNVEGTVKVSKGSVEILSNFVVKPEDYKIAIPSLVRDNIAKEIKVTVSAVLQPLKS